MLKKLNSINLLLVVICVFCTLTSFAKTYGNVKCTYIKNYDGDTITVNIPNYPAIIGKNISIRVNGIDTPELRTKSPKEKQLARTAKRIVKNLLKNAKVIELKNMQRGKYFRVVADVYYDGKKLADVLIKNNIAVEYDGGTKTKNWSK